MRLIILSFLTLTSFLLGDTTLTPQARAHFSIPTTDGAFYQIEVKKDEKWEPLGEPIKGTGQIIERTLPASPTDTFRLTPLKNQWVLVWQDEFDGPTIDFAKWSHVVDGYGGGNNELQYYSDEPKYSHVEDGLLKLKVYRDPFTTVDGKTQPYSSARLHTKNRGEWKFGRIEVRAKMPSGQGIWPAVWLLPTQSPYGGWAAGGEIDLIESRGSEVDSTIGTLHFGGPWPKNEHRGGSTKFPDKNAAEDFHLYAIEWNKDEISWFLNGQKWQTITKDQWWTSATKEKEKDPSAPFDHEFHLIINLAVGGHFFGGTGQDPNKLTGEDFPQTLAIDYIRVSQWAE